MANGRDIIDSGSGSWWRADEPVGRTRAELPSVRGLRDPNLPGAGEVEQMVGGQRARPPRTRLVALLVATALVGCVVGAYAQRQIGEASAEGTARAVLDVRLADESLIGVGGDPTSPGYVFQLVLRNEGPRPVVVENLALLGDPLSSNPLDGPITLPPDDDVPVQVSGTLDCGAVPNGGVPPVTASATVQTEDGRRHEVRLGAGDSASRRALIHGCGGRPVIEVVQSFTSQVVGKRVESRVDLRSQTGAVQVVGLHIEPAGTFATRIDGLPLTLTGDASGRVLLSASVADCARALAFQPSQYVLVLDLFGAPRARTPLPIPDDLGPALVRLSERSCRP